MKNIFTINYKSALALSFFFGIKTIVTAQCGIPMVGGSSFNMLTQIKNCTNPVVADKNLNTVVFLHRHQSNIFGGNSGNLRYDISTNGGSSWTTNIGVLNPLSTSYARYPNVTIYNPSGNTNPLNAYIGYMAATINTNNSAWNGNVTGVRQLSGIGNTEVYNQPSGANNLIPASLVKGSPGTYWSMDLTYNGTNYTGGINVYKGVWNGSGNINWTTNTVFTPAFNTTYNGNPVIGEYNIAFDPTGNFGWACVMTDLATGPGNYGYYPVFYKTTDGGNTWSGPIEVDLFQFSCITANIFGGNTPATNYMADLAVDVNGNPHLLTTVGYCSNAYGLNYSSWHHLFDITQMNGVWTAYDVANINGAGATYNGSNSSIVTQEATPQVARTADGTKLFFSWTDNSSYSLGSQNFSPNLFAKGFDVVQNKWTQAKDFSSCNVNTAGKILFPHLAEEVLEPSIGVYKIAPVYAEFAVAGNPDQQANFKFLDNATFNATDFTVNQSSLSLSIQQGSLAILCPGSSINLQISGSYSQILWTGGNTTLINSVNTPGIYYVAARSGCSIGSASIAVNSLSMSVTSSTPTICEGNSVTLNVAGNAYGYTWTPGAVSGNSLVAFPSASTVYTVTGSGNGNCTSNSVVNVSVSAAPSIFALSNQSIACAGMQLVLQAGGANIYLWNTGATTSSIAVYPTTTTLYSVTGFNNFGCSATFTINQIVAPCLGINGAKANNDLIKVYPNPSNGNLKIQSDSEVTLRLINEIGQLIKTIHLDLNNNYEMQLNALPKGLYFVSGDNDHTQIKQKIIVE